MTEAAEVAPEAPGTGQTEVTSTPATEGGLLGSAPPITQTEITTQEAMSAGAVEEPSIYGQLQVEWPEGLEDTYRNEPVLKPYVDTEGKFNINGALKSLVHAQKNIGRDRVLIPGSEAPREDWVAFHEKAFGYSQDPEEYQVEYDMESEDNALEPEFVQSFVDHAHASMYPATLVSDVLEYMNEQVDLSLQTQEEAGEQYTEDAIAELRDEWGGAFEKKMLQAKHVIDTYGDEQFVDYVNASELKNDVQLARFLAGMGEALFGEDSFHGNNIGAMAGQLAPDEAQLEINNIYGDSEHPYHQKGHPQHEDAQAHMLKLFSMKRGERVR